MDKQILRDMEACQCPRCGYQTTEAHGRRCPCGYSGDWIQPGEVLTYGERKVRGVPSLVTGEVP